MKERRTANRKVDKTLERNGINKNEFIKDVLALTNREYSKKNCLCLMGESSSMKSTIARSIKAMIPMAVSKCKAENLHSETV